MPRQAALDRFMEKVSPEPNSGCWLWLGHGNVRPNFSFRGTEWVAARAAYTLLKAEIPAGSFICHTCDNGQCVNPDHLYVGDAVTNARDMVERRRHAAHRDFEGYREIQRRGAIAAHARKRSATDVR